MKSIQLNLLRAMSLGLFVVMVTATAAAQSQSARIQTAQLDTIAAKASQVINVDLDERVMQFAAKFLNNKEPDEAAVKKLVNGLKSIHVKALEFETEGQYTTADLEAIRTQVRNAPWNRVMGVTSKREGNVEVYLLMEGPNVGGLAILAFGPKELAVVNIVGPVDLDKLSKLEGSFGIPELEIETKPKPKPRKE